MNIYTNHRQIEQLAPMSSEDPNLVIVANDHSALQWHTDSQPYGKSALPRHSGNTPIPENQSGDRDRLQTGQSRRPQSATLVTDAQPQSWHARHAHNNVDHTTSDGGSLDVRLEHTSLNDQQHGNSQKSSRSHKRTGDEMQGPNPLPQHETRPLKQPFSPSSSRSPQHSRGDSTNQPRGARPTETTSPVAVAAGLQGHYHSNIPSNPHDYYKNLDRTTDFGLATETLLVKQPATRPITEQQLINEVKGIYAGLVMVEKKCVEIVAQQSQSTKRLSDQQWKALVALHRTLLQEHHDFFSASQHPTASETLKKLAIKYAMPARMWRHGIHAFLELLRHRLPDSMEHMLSFIYLSYSMMALLKESVPTFVETWIECLGDLARYRMAIEDTDPRDREIWSNVAKMWYNEAADKSPNVGRIQHHLAVLARPNIIEQLFYYDKALVSVVPFVNARESIMLLFDMFLKNSEAVQTRYPPTEYAFVNTYAMLFTRGNPVECSKMLQLFKSSFGGHMDRAGARFKLQGPQIASALFGGLLDFGKEESHLLCAYNQQAEEAEARRKAYAGHPEKMATAEAQYMCAWHHKYWSELALTKDVKRHPPPPVHDAEVIANSEAAVAIAAPLTFETITAVASRIGDKNIVPFMHVVLANLWDMSFVEGALTYIEACINWTAIVSFLNTIGRSGVAMVNAEADSFPPSHGGHGRQLPEDFLMRGMTTTRHYYEPQFFAGPLVDDDERTIELPSHQAPRAERCLWLGVRLSKLGRYFTYDQGTQMFETTELGSSLTTIYV